MNALRSGLEAEDQQNSPEANMMINAGQMTQIRQGNQPLGMFGQLIPEFKGSHRSQQSIHEPSPVEPTVAMNNGNSHQSSL